MLVALAARRSLKLRQKQRCTSRLAHGGPARTRPRARNAPTDACASRHPPVRKPRPRALLRTRGAALRARETLIMQPSAVWTYCTVAGRGAQVRILFTHAARLVSVAVAAAATRPVLESIISIARTAAVASATQTVCAGGRSSARDGEGKRSSNHLPAGSDERRCRSGAACGDARGDAESLPGKHDTMPQSEMVRAFFFRGCRAPPLARGRRGKAPRA